MSQRKISKRQKRLIYGFCWCIRASFDWLVRMLTKIDKLNGSLRIFKLIESSFISSLILLQFFLPPRYLQQTCRIMKLPLKFFHCECFLPGYDDNFNNTIGSKYLDYIDNDHMNNDNKYL